MTTITTIIKAELEWTGTGKFDRDVEVVITSAAEMTEARAGFIVNTLYPNHSVATLELERIG